MCPTRISLGHWLDTSKTSIKPRWGLCLSDFSIAPETSIDIILQLIKDDPSITRKALAEIVGISQSAIQKHINRLKAESIIVRNGGDRGGHWEIINKQRKIVIDMLFGKKIRELRDEQGVLQRQLAALLEIDTPMFR